MAENVQPNAERFKLGQPARRADDTIRKRITIDNQILWPQVDTTGSLLTDIETRNHSDLQNIGVADDTSADTVKDKHVSNAEMKANTDHRAKEADDTDTDVTRDKHVSNNDMKTNTDHRAATSAHGASGDIVGTTDYATEALGGVVLLCDLVNDVAAATVTSLTDSTGGTANTTLVAISGSGDDANINNNFADIVAEFNKLITDVADIRTQVNDLIAEMKTAKQMNTV